MAAEMKRKGVTLVLLWEEYRAAHLDGYGYTWLSNRAPPVKPAGKSLAASPLTGRTRASSDAFRSR